MHILAGILLSTLFTQGNRRKSRSYTVGMGDKQLQVSHALPGRIRLHHKAFMQPVSGKALTERLQQVKGIHQVSVNPKTGSLLISYDCREMKEEILTAAIYQLLGYGSLDDSKASAKISEEIHYMHQAANHALMQKTNGAIDIHTLLAGGFLAVALKEYWKTKSLGTPAPITLLYWTYRMMGLHR
ncbi:hypothetical protein SAMN05192551_104218 [Tindallia magadiensis]|uniref:Uncharacterized protein n=1 Tax=Tindallia magadiensis TaxID=69895 RepID=A0A1I3E2T3_9FIRM|nr:heavy-metal-associated domain-containing protein [Tindallia magadiensis]SFH93332.1 hypothetical protein SAMN05192551_104218 [Tindallia magadiensis]